MLAPRAVRWLAPVAAAFALDVGLLLATRPRGAPELALLGIAVALAVLLGFLAIFFRDPERPVGDGIVSAADGVVREVATSEGRLTISVFLGVTDVHVNRWPLDGAVEAIAAEGSGFRPAYRADAASNVRRRYLLRTEIGPVELVQIAGIAARRLVSFVEVGSSGKKGDRLGMIVLGSRVDVVLPADRAIAAVRVGERVRGASSTIARVVP